MERENKDDSYKEEILDIQLDILTEDEAKKVAQKYVDFANAIVPNSTKEIADLKTGKVWLHLLNKVFHRNYKSKNPKKNYNNCIKMLQANDIDAGFILEDLKEVLEGKEKENIYIASAFREILNHGDYNGEGGDEICDEIETAYKKIQESRNSNVSKNYADVAKRPEKIMDIRKIEKEDDEDDYAFEFAYDNPALFDAQVKAQYKLWAGKDIDWSQFSGEEREMLEKTKKK